MPRLARNALVALLVALHAAVAVCGAGLHALPGFGHDSGLHPAARNDHSHGPGKSARDAADECPVCQFLVQGQLPRVLAIGATDRLAVEAVSPSAVVPDFVSPRRASAPRGPPPLLRSV